MSDLAVYQEYKETIYSFKEYLEGAEFRGFIDRRIKNGTRKLDKLEDPEAYSTEKERMRRNIYVSMAGLENGKVYEVEDKIKKICANSKVPPNTEKFAFLPFRYIFIDVDFDGEEFGLKDKRLCGILVSEAQLVSGTDELTYLKLQNAGKNPGFIKQSGKALNALVLSADGGGHIFLDSLTFAHKIEDDYKDLPLVTKNLPNSAFIKRFVLNFLNFLNDPDVVEVEVKRSKKNALRRIKNGKMPLPSSSKVKVNGMLKKYIDSQSGTSGWSVGFRFPVRKHLRRYRDKEGNITKIVKVKSHYRGEGVTVENNYEVVANKKHSKVKEYNEENFDIDDIKPLSKPLSSMNTNERTKIKKKKL